MIHIYFMDILVFTITLPEAVLKNYSDRLCAVIAL